jgi:hypothetical protein
MSYIFLTLYIVPNFRKRNNTILFSILALITFVTVSMILAVCDTWLMAYKITDPGMITEFNEGIFKERAVFGLWLMFFLSFIQ